MVRETANGRDDGGRRVAGGGGAVRMMQCTKAGEGTKCVGLGAHGCPHMREHEEIVPLCAIVMTSSGARRLGCVEGATCKQVYPMGKSDKSSIGANTLKWGPLPDEYRAIMGDGSREPVAK